MISTLLIWAPSKDCKWWILPTLILTAWTEVFISSIFMLNNSIVSSLWLFISSHSSESGIKKRLTHFLNILDNHQYHHHHSHPLDPVFEPQTKRFCHSKWNLCYPSKFCSLHLHQLRQCSFLRVAYSSQILLNGWKNMTRSKQRKLDTLGSRTNNCGCDIILACYWTAWRYLFRRWRTDGYQIIYLIFKQYILFSLDVFYVEAIFISSLNFDWILCSFSLILRS